MSEEGVEQQIRQDAEDETRKGRDYGDKTAREEDVNTSMLCSVGNPEEDFILARMREQREFERRDDEEGMERKERGGAEGGDVESSSVVECSGRCLSFDDAKEQQSFGIRRRRRGAGG